MDGSGEIRDETGGREMVGDWAGVEGMGILCAQKFGSVKGWSMGGGGAPRGRTVGGLTLLVKFARLHRQAPGGRPRWLDGQYTSTMILGMWPQHCTAPHATTGSSTEMTPTDVRLGGGNTSRRTRRDEWLRVMLFSCAGVSKTARAVAHDPAPSILWNLNHKRLGRSNVSIALDI